MKLEKYGGFTNPLTSKGVRALAIVLGVLVIIAGIVYATNFGKRERSTIFPAKTLVEVTVTVQPTITLTIPTITPLIKNVKGIKTEKLTASPSSTINVSRPVLTQTPVFKGVTVTPAPTK